MPDTQIDFSDCTVIDIILKAGIGGTINITVLQAGVAANLTGATIKYQANLTPALVKTVGSGITVPNPVTGIFSLAFEETDSSAIAVLTSVLHECRVQLLGEEPAMLFEGHLRVEKAVFVTM